MSCPASSPSGTPADGDEAIVVGTRSPRLLVALKIAIGVLAVLFVVFSAAGIWLYSVSSTLPDLDVLSAARQVSRTSIVYAADGSVLAEWHGAQDRRMIDWNDVARPLRDAVVAIEDERFYDLEDSDWLATLRSSGGDGARGSTPGGGSITRQLVKLLAPQRKRTLDLKVREALLAYRLEQRTDKRKVLEAYLNLAYFGRGSYGAESAARTYFAKPASQLSLSESAMLAGLIRSPKRYSPIDNPVAARERRDLVLARMQQHGYISAEEEQAALTEAIVPAPPREVAKVAPYFVEYVKQELTSRLGAQVVARGGLRVQTTLEPSMQAAAEKSARHVLPSPGDPEVAIVSLSPSTGEILAMVGGKDFARNQFNLAAQGRRQPGSAFKPFVLVTALDKGYSPDRVFDASPYSVKVKDGIWRVDNYEGGSVDRSVTLRAATIWSVNAVYARLVMSVGPKDVVATAHRMGITSPLDPDPAIALGGLRVGVSPLEMASAFGTLANGGFRVAPNSVSRVTDDRGQVVYAPRIAPLRVLSQRTASTASQMLRDVVERGTGTAARIPVRAAAGKTGTTQSYRDAWFVGWAGDVSTAVWVGYADKQVAMTNVHGIKVTGGSFPAAIWGYYMSAASAPRSAAEPRPTAAPGGLVLCRVCEESMMLANKLCTEVSEVYLLPDQVPSGVCQLH